jgi:HSP20 family protein
MALVPWRPFGDFDRFFDPPAGGEDWFLPVAHRSGITEPAMDLYETEKEVVAEVSLPDIDPDKMDVTVENGILRISGSTEEEKTDEGKGYYRKEIRKGSFERIARLPSPVDEAAVNATYEKGMLKIVMPKKKTDKAKPKKIKVTEKK